METYGNLAESDDVVGHSQDSGLENCEFAEEKSGAGEGNRTLVKKNDPFRMHLAHEW